MRDFSISFFLVLIISIMMLSADVANIEPAILNEKKMTNNTTLEQQLTISAQTINKMTSSDTDGGGLMGFLRRNLVGSNCVLISRGVTTPYYKCIGCDIELAIGCINDMRTNASFNVAPGCLFSYNQEQYSQGGGHDDFTASDATTPTRKYHLNPCCPSLITMSTGVKNLQYIGAAYPMALDCITKVGCSSSSIFTQLSEECKLSCPIIQDPVDKTLRYNVDQKGERSICYAQFNSVFRSISPSFFLFLWVTIGSLLFITM